MRMSLGFISIASRLVYEIENDALFNFFYLSDSGELSSILLADSP